MSESKLLNSVNGKNEVRRAAIRKLEHNGFIRVDHAGQGSTSKHYSVKPYRQKNDPDSDMYDPQEPLIY
jgi:hypothetical protein